MKLNINFDFSNLFHKSYHVTKHMKKDFDLSKDTHYATFIRKLFIDFCATVRFLSDGHTINNIFICFDDGTFRKDFCDKYKASRLPKEQDFYKAMDECYKIFHSKKLNALRITGLEADDLVGLVSRASSSDILNIIVSMDEDTHQLVSNNTIIYNNNSQKKKIFIHGTQSGINVKNYLEQQFKNEIPITLISPFEILMQKVFLGCEGDEVQRLLPKGKGQSLINKVLKKQNLLWANVIDDDEIVFQLIDMCQHLDLMYDADEIFLQMVRVCLHQLYYPEELVDQFNSLPIFAFVPIEFKMSNLLSETKYIHYI